MRIWNHSSRFTAGITALVLTASACGGGEATSGGDDAGTAPAVGADEVGANDPSPNGGSADLDGDGSTGDVGGLAQLVTASASTAAFSLNGDPRDVIPLYQWEEFCEVLPWPNVTALLDATYVPRKTNVRDHDTSWSCEWSTADFELTVGIHEDRGADLAAIPAEVVLDTPAVPGASSALLLNDSKARIDAELTEYGIDYGITGLTFAHGQSILATNGTTVVRVGLGKVNTNDTVELPDLPGGIDQIQFLTGIASLVLAGDVVQGTQADGEWSDAAIPAELLESDADWWGGGWARGHEFVLGEGRTAATVYVSHEAPDQADHESWCTQLLTAFVESVPVTVVDAYDDGDARFRIDVETDTHVGYVHCDARDELIAWLLPA